MKKISMFYAIVCLITFIIVPFVNAEEFSRAGDIEVFVSGYSIDSDNVDIEGINGEIEIDKQVAKIMNIDDIDKQRYFDFYIRPFIESIVLEFV